MPRQATQSQEPPSVQKVRAEKEPTDYPPGTKHPKPPLPIWKIREGGSQARKTVKVKGAESRTVQAQKHAYTTAETQQEYAERLAYTRQSRRIHREESVQRERDVLPIRREQRAEIRGERRGERRRVFVERSAMGAGRAAATSNIGANLLRVAAIMLVLIMLFLVVSNANAAGNAFQKFGDFLGKFTSPQPLFVKNSAK
jgi:hypothetical protein